MSEQSFSVEGILDALAMQPSRVHGDGKALMLVSARRGEGVTRLAREVAVSSAPGSVYALDLDLKRNALARALSETGSLGPRISGVLNGASFYELRTATGQPIREPALAFNYHRVGRTRIYAGIFDARLAPKGARVVISSRSDYWDAARAGGGRIIVDAPALERSQIALRVARHMDGVVLVVGAEPGAAPAALAAKTALDEAGANLMGLVYVGATAPVMAIERMLRQAG